MEVPLGGNENWWDSGAVVYPLDGLLGQMHILFNKRSMTEWRRATRHCAIVPCECCSAREAEERLRAITFWSQILIDQLTHINMILLCNNLINLNLRRSSVTRTNKVPLTATFCTSRLRSTTAYNNKASVNCTCQVPLFQNLLAEEHVWRCETVQIQWQPNPTSRCPLPTPLRTIHHQPHSYLGHYFQVLYGDWMITTKKSSCLLFTSSSCTSIKWLPSWRIYLMQNSDWEVTGRVKQSETTRYFQVAKVFGITKTTAVLIDQRYLPDVAGVRPRGDRRDAVQRAY